MAIIAGGLRSVGRSLEEMSDDTEPRSAALYEMEINVNGFGLAVLKYQYRADPRFRAWAEKDERDFARFHALFMTLTDSDHETRLGEEIGRLFAGYRTAGRVLIRARDKQEALFSEVTRSFEAMDDLVDRELQPRLRAAKIGRVAALEAVLDFEADVAEVGHSLARYRRVPSPEHRRLLRKQMEEVRAAMTQVRALPRMAAVTPAVTELGRLVEHTLGLAWSAVVIEDGIHRRSQRLIALREEIDHLLDTELQVLSSVHLSRPRRAGAEAARRVVASIWILVPLFLISAVVVALAMRAILRPLGYLMHGTRQVGAGNLGHRIVVQGRDELADLGRAFNRMVADLEATTVSKTRLEASERQLERTVEALRLEIAERQRTSEERARLEASLRESEVMSAMGALVAGVAHEVRTPLFGISSVVDALETRLQRVGQGAALGEHLGVLRGEVERLSRVMRDLIEFGRPATGDRVEAPLVDVVREALALCAAQAAEGGVTLDPVLGDEPFPMTMARERLVQVFRNVVENAIQHTPRGGGVRIALRRADDGTAECVISDTGGGIPPDDVPHVFDPFFSRRRGGTGLGLAVVRRIVVEHHGSVTAANAVGGGAAFVIRLPVAARDAPREVGS